MSTTPPEDSTSTTGPQPSGERPSYSYSTATAGLARLPIPGNAEFPVWLLVLLVIAIVWIASDAVDAGGFVVATTWLTAAYLISRGIAKASRVLEQ